MLAITSHGYLTVPESAPTVGAPCTAHAVQGERRGTSTGSVAEPQSRAFGEPQGAPPDQKEPRVPQPGLFRFPGRVYRLRRGIIGWSLLGLVARHAGQA